MSSAAIVMPSWAPESCNDSSRSDLRTVRAARSPAWACASIAARSTVTSENSAATKNALAAVSSAKATRGSAVMRTSIRSFCPTPAQAIASTTSVWLWKPSMPPTRAISPYV